ncbi:phage tail fiber protein [Actinacidiphila glaucinigra]|uniref:phage tail fiber protein n=1 Tax=Actinacidiphila glaucinigra TaxID=235986 RepID=UPI00366B5DB6
MAATGFIAVSGAVSALDYLAGRATGLDAEWQAKTAGGDPQPKTTYLMLLTQVIADGQTDMTTLVGIEAAGTGYARQPIPWGAASTGSRMATTTDLVQFGPFSDPTGLAAPVTGAALVTRMTSSAGQPSGLCLMAWNLDQPITTQQNQALQVAAGSLSMTLAVT